MIVACICGGTFEVLAGLWIVSMIGLLFKKIKERCCCPCHKEDKHENERR